MFSCDVLISTLLESKAAPEVA